MNSSSCTDTCRTVTAYVIGGVGSFLIIGVLAWLVVGNKTPAVDAQRVSERVKFRADVEAPYNELKTYGTVQGVPNAGSVYRLPIERSLQLMAQEWGNAAEGREKLLKRLEAANTKPSFE